MTNSRVGETVLLVRESQVSLCDACRPLYVGFVGSSLCACVNKLGANLTTGLCACVCACACVYMCVHVCVCVCVCVEVIERDVWGAKFNMILVQSMFGEGNVVLLKSASTGKNLRIMNGSEVNGNGGEGKKGQLRSLYFLCSLPPIPSSS